MNNSVQKLIPFCLPLISLAALLILFGAVSPLSVGPIGILGAFALLYVFFASIFFLILRLAIIIFPRLIPRSSIRKLYYVSSTIAFAPVFLLALHSIGQLEIKDFILVLALVGISSFYIIRRVR